MDEDIGNEPINNLQIGSVFQDFQITEVLLERARNYIQNSKNYFESQRQEWSDKLRKIDKIYRVILENNRGYQGYQDKVSGIIHDNVETITARLKESILFNSESIFDLKSNSLSSQMIEARKEQIKKQISDNEIELKLEKICRIVTKFGTCFLSCVYTNNSHQILTRQVITKQIPEIDQNGKPIIGQDGKPIIKNIQSIEIIPQFDTKYSGPGYQVIDDPEDIYLDMFIEDIQKQPIVIRRILVDWEHLQNGIKSGIYFEDQVKKIKDYTYSESGIKLRRSQKILGSIASNSYVLSRLSDGKPKLYEMWQAYCDFSVMKTLSDGTEVEQISKSVISIINDHVIQLMPNPYFHQMIPIIAVRYRTIEGEAYGIGAVEPIIDTFYEYLDLNNQKNDVRTISVNPPIIMREGSLSTKQDIEVYPGKIMYEKNTGDIRILSWDWGPILNSEQSLEILEQRINRVMGITPLLLGQGDSTDLDKTWRGTNKIIQQADKKFKMIAKGIEDSAIRQWIEMAYKINVQFTPAQIQNGQFEHINSEIGIIVKGVESFFKMIEIADRILAIVNLAGSIPGFNIVGMILRLIELWGIDISEERFGPIYSPPTPPEPETKPLNVSTNIVIDPSKGIWNKYAATQLLLQKGIVIDLDGIRSAQDIEKFDDKQVKKESGTLPPQLDSYPETDRRTNND